MSQQKTNEAPDIPRQQRDPTDVAKRREEDHGQRDDVVQNGDALWRVATIVQGRIVRKGRSAFGFRCRDHDVLDAWMRVWTGQTWAIRRGAVEGPWIGFSGAQSDLLERPGHERLEMFEKRPGALGQAARACNGRAHVEIGICKAFRFEGNRAVH